MCWAATTRHKTYRTKERRNQCCAVFFCARLRRYPWSVSGIARKIRKVCHGLLKYFQRMQESLCSHPKSTKYGETGKEDVFYFTSALCCRQVKCFSIVKWIVTKLLPFRILIDNLPCPCYTTNCKREFISCIAYRRGVEQSVARRAHNPEVVGSSPSPATNK